ncbi:hypothetical protein B566_EDAN015190 [Ephemera danica]|nr:hypothetical protein B566_EDAN015190 [Ephemera danica]
MVCNTLCVDRAPCKTDFAFYNHAAPAYQAYRGRCMCYSGKFICMRPSPDMYDLPEGVFLFLGYSETDETLLKPHSNLTVHDTPEALQHLLPSLYNLKRFLCLASSFVFPRVFRILWECALYLYNVTKENVIIVAKLANENYTFNREHIKHTSPDQLQHEKEECSGPLQDLSDKINNQHAKLHTHQLLSILKMAEVEIKVPASSSGSRLFWGSSWSTPLCLLWLLAVSRPVLYAHTWAFSPS